MISYVAALHVVETGTIQCQPSVLQESSLDYIRPIKLYRELKQGITKLVYYLVHSLFGDVRTPADDSRMRLDICGYSSSEAENETEDGGCVGTPSPLILVCWSTSLS